jgi:hypothetical protein
MTITDEARATNGHAKGRAAGERSGLDLPSGYRVIINRQPADIFTKVTAAARSELEAERPKPPTQSLETEPDVFREIANESDPDYLAAQAQFERRVAMLAGAKLTQIMLEIGIEFEVDDKKLTKLRTVYRTTGVDLPDDDRMAWLTYVLAPAQEDMARIFVAVYGPGLPTEQQVAFQQAMFPSHVSGDAA